MRKKIEKKNETET